MIDLKTLVTFMGIVIGLFLIPGPAVLLTLGRTLAGGLRAGLLTGLGIALGDIIHVMFSVLGLSAILMTSAVAFQVVKFAGVAYLIYLGVRSLLEKPHDLTVPQVKSVSSRQAFQQGLLTELLNPKTALFFLAFLPQFTHPERGAIPVQLLTLGIVFVILSVLYTSVVALGSHQAGSWLKRHPAVGRWQGKVVGSIYLLLGARLALQHR